MKNKRIKKGLVIGLSAMMLVSTITPVPTQAATWKQNKTGWWWQEDNGSYPVSTWKKIRGSWYYFDQKGYMKTGWLKDKGNWYYLGKANDGAMKTGWQKVNGKWYYMDASGKMAANTWIGNWYVDSSGAWTKTRQPAKWIKSGNRWWYRHSDGGYTTNGWEKINGNWYYFDGSGWMVTGWRKVNNQWYYMNTSGAMVKNTWVGEYYLGANGAMATDTWIGQYYVDSNGKRVPDKKQEIALQSISLNQTSLDMWVGGSETLKVTYTPSNTTVDKTVTWKSSDENVVTVKDGKIEAVGEGEAVITAEVAGKQASCTVNAKQYYHLSLTFYNFVPVGKKVDIWVADETGSMVGYNKIYSLNKDIADFDDDGYLVGMSAGTATIGVEGDGKICFTKFEVKTPAKIEKAVFDSDTYTMKTGDKLQLKVTVIPDNAMVGQARYWYSSDPEVAEVDGEGIVRAIGEGETEISCSMMDVYTMNGEPGTPKYTTRCKVKVEGIGTNTEFEDIKWELTDINNKGEYVKVGDIITPNIKVYPVTYPYSLKDVEFSIEKSWQEGAEGLIPEEGIVEITDENKIKICKPGVAYLKAVLNGKEAGMRFVCE